MMKLTTEQQRKLLDYARNCIDGKSSGSFRNLIYAVLTMPRDGNSYSQAMADGLLDINNSLGLLFCCAEKQQRKESNNENIQD